MLILERSRARLSRSRGFRLIRYLHPSFLYGLGALRLVLAVNAFHGGNASADPVRAGLAKLPGPEFALRSK
jgi:hypothetical protein